MPRRRYIFELTSSLAYKKVAKFNILNTKLNWENFALESLKLGDHKNKKEM
jgi:hypothetical protein